MKILIVEDNEEISLLLCEYLQGEGHDTSVAANGSIALEKIKDVGVPDLILLDMMMPVMDGTQFAIELRLKYQHPCPIIVMSAAVDIAARAREINAVSWISKPLRFTEILKLVEQFS